MSTLIISDLCKSYGKTAVLHSLNLTLGEGITGLLGANGAGKTTLMRILATVQKADSGSILYNGCTWTKADEVRKLIGYIPQSFNMFPLLTVKEMLIHLARMKEIPTRQIRTEVDRVIEATNLSMEASKYIKNLSGGMLRRLGIAQCLLGNPPILLLDEPTVGLDPEEQVRFRAVLKPLSSGHIILFSTHIVSEIGAICDRYAILNNHSISSCGSLPLQGDDSLEEVYMRTARRDVP